MRNVTINGCINDLSIKRWIFFTAQIYGKLYCRCFGWYVTVNVGLWGLVSKEKDRCHAEPVEA